MGKKRGPGGDRRSRPADGPEATKAKRSGKKPAKATKPANEGPKAAGFIKLPAARGRIADNREQMVASFLAAARALIEEDSADVIIAQGITQCPVQMKPQWLSAELGVPVVEGIGAPIRMAAMLVGLGLTQSRVRWQKEGSQPR